MRDSFRSLCLLLFNAFAFKRISWCLGALVVTIWSSVWKESNVEHRNLAHPQSSRCLRRKRPRASARGHRRDVHLRRRVLRSDERAPPWPRRDRVAGAIRATHPDFQYQPIADPEELGNAGRLRWVAGRPGEANCHFAFDLHMLISAEADLRLRFAPWLERLLDDDLLAPIRQRLDGNTLQHDLRQMISG
jgi:hypothetical protein